MAKNTGRTNRLKPPIKPKVSWADWAAWAKYKEDLAAYKAGQAKIAAHYDTTNAGKKREKGREVGRRGTANYPRTPRNEGTPPSRPNPPGELPPVIVPDMRTTMATRTTTRRTARRRRRNG